MSHSHRPPPRIVQWNRRVNSFVRMPFFPLAQRPKRRMIRRMLMVLYIIGGFLFLASGAAHLYVRLRLRPGEDSDLDDYYYEFEDQHPEYARYTKWLQITMGGAALGLLLLFAGAVI